MDPSLWWSITRPTSPPSKRLNGSINGGEMIRVFDYRDWRQLGGRYGVWRSKESFHTTEISKRQFNYTRSEHRHKVILFVFLTPFRPFRSKGLYLQKRCVCYHPPRPSNSTTATFLAHKYSELVSYETGSFVSMRLLFSCLFKTFCRLPKLCNVKW
jgi:hypothetical protein